MKYKIIGIFNSTYSLLLFLLLEKARVNDTLFVFWHDIPEDIACHFNFVRNNERDGGYHNPVVQFFFNILNRIKTYYFILKYAKRTTSFYGQDHLPFSRHIINYTRFLFINIEDGKGNYIHKPYKSRKFDVFRKLLGFEIEDTFGYSNRVKKQYLTSERQLNTLPSGIQGKSTILNINSAWQMLSNKEKDRILDFFNFNVNLKSSKNIPIVLTGPYDCENVRVCSEKEKIELIRYAIREEKVNSFIIKPHYREKTDYCVFFENAEILPPTIPFELIMLVYNDVISKIIAFHNTTSLDFLKENFGVEIVEYNIFEFLNKTRQNGTN